MVYQHSSAETHLFNETTVSILGCLNSGELTAADLKKCTLHVLNHCDEENLSDDDFMFALQRLEDLGLVERVGDPCLY